MPTLSSWFIAHGIKVIIILFAAFFINRIGRKFIEKAVRGMIKSADRDSKAKRENTLIRIFSGALKVLLWLIAVMMILPEFGINVGPILAGAGILGVALGFGAQWMIRDFLAGLFIILENQYRVGDVVCLDNTCGFVEDITLRKTVMRDLDGKLHHIPNGSFGKTANMTYDFSRAHTIISVAYKEDIDKVIALLNKIGQEMAREEPWKGYIKKPIQVLGPGPDSFGANSIDIRVMGETKTFKHWDTLKEFRRRVKKAFDKEGIEIPFPQMSVWPRGKWEK